MNTRELEKKMTFSKERIMLKLRSEILPFYKKIKILSQEEKKCEDLSDYGIKIIIDLIEKDIEYRGVFDDLDAWKILMDALENYQLERVDRRPYRLNHDFDDIDEAVDSGIVFFKTYEEIFRNDGSHSKFTCNNKGVQIIDGGNGDVEFSFNMEDGNIIDRTPWKILPEDTREFLATYIVTGFLEQELLKHQLDLRKMGFEYITLDDFVGQYRKIKKGVDACEIEKEELDAYVAQYVKDSTEDVIVLSEENISEILSFCKSEIMQNALEQNEVICDSEYADRFIRNLLVLHRRRLENDSEALEKIDKYIDFFDISKGIGLRKNETMGGYYYGGNIAFEHVFSYTGEWDFQIRRDKWGDNEEYLSGHKLDELRKIDEETGVLNGGNFITIDEFIKKKILRVLMPFLRQEIVTKQIEIREKYCDTAFSFEDEIVKLIKIWALSEDKDSKKDDNFDTNLNSLYKLEDELGDVNKSTVLLSEENVDELMELLNEGLVDLDFSDEEQCKWLSGRMDRFTTKILSNLMKKIQQGQVTDESAKKIERIKAYEEYLMKCHSAFCWDPDYEWYEYIVDEKSFEIVLHTPRAVRVYRMDDGREFFNDNLSWKADAWIKPGYLRSLDERTKDTNQIEKADEAENSDDSLKKSLRKIYTDSDQDRRTEFHQMIDKLIGDLEEQR